MKNNLILLLCSLFTFCTFIFVIIATAGSSSDYKPITNIYLGVADISKINVTKVVPQVGGILTILGSALTAPNSTLDDIFGALKQISETPALAPLLNLMSNAQNSTATVDSIISLSPLALTSTNSTNEEMDEINSLLAGSKNVTETIAGFGTLMDSMLGSNSTSNSSSMADLQNTVFSLLADSTNATGTTEALITLNNMTMAEKAQLLPAFGLFSSSNNITMTFASLVDLMNATIPASLESTLFQQIEKAIDSNEDLNTVFTGLQSLVPSPYQSSLTAVANLFNASTSANTTYQSLTEMIADNITTSASAKVALTSLSTIVGYSQNKTVVLSSVESLATAADASSATAQLVSLDTILSASENSTETVETIAKLNAGLPSNMDTVQYIPYLFTLLNASKDPAVTFSSLLNITAWAKTNAATFLPLIKILKNAASVTEITDGQLRDLTPSLLEYLHVPVKFRLGIFRLCHANLENEIMSCTPRTTVQNLDFRQIIYDAIEQSDFKPYMDALKIGPNDLMLDGSLQDKEHMYVPAVKASLAMFLLAIIGSFFLLCLLLWVCFKNVLVLKIWLLVVFLSMWVALFSGLGSSIFSGMVGVIKSGTKKDNYGVTCAAGSAFYGLMWTGFTLAFITMLILMWQAWNVRKSVGVVINEEEAAEHGEVEMVGGDSGSVSSKVSEQKVFGGVEKISDKE